jgi:hypothetical protein
MGHFYRPALHLHLTMKFFALFHFPLGSAAVTLDRSSQEIPGRLHLIPGVITGLTCDVNIYKLPAINHFTLFRPVYCVLYRIIIIYSPLPSVLVNWLPLKFNVFSI